MLPKVCFIQLLRHSFKCSHHTLKSAHIISKKNDQDEFGNNKNKRLSKSLLLELNRFTHLQSRLRAKQHGLNLRMYSKRSKCLITGCINQGQKLDK